MMASQGQPILEAPMDTPRPKQSGRPRANLEAHKAQILALYAAKTPWHKIEAVLLAEHGIKAQGRTIMRRMRDDWGVEFRRVETDRNQQPQLKARIAALWRDRDTRPKTDQDLHAQLKSDGFTVSLAAIHGLRKDMSLFRRWDEKFGRVRPEDELGRRKRRSTQKHSAFTGAHLAPPADVSEEEADKNDGSGDDESSPQHPPAEPTREGWYPGLTLPKPKKRIYRRQQKSVSAQPSQPEQSPHLNQVVHSTPSPAILPPPPAQQMPQPSAVLSDSDKDIQIRALLDRVHLLEQHCLAHAIGFPGQQRRHSPANTDVHGLQSLAAAVDMGDWQHGSTFSYDASTTSLRQTQPGADNVAILDTGNTGKPVH